MPNEYNQYLQSLHFMDMCFLPTKQGYIDWIKDQHRGRFFYAFQNYSILHPKSLRCKVAGFRWRKFKALIAGCEVEYFDNLLIYRG